MIKSVQSISVDPKFFEKGRYKSVEKSLKILATDLLSSLKITEEALESLEKGKDYQICSVFAQMRICLADSARGDPLLFHISNELHYPLSVYVPNEHSFSMNVEEVPPGYVNFLCLTPFRLERSQDFSKEIGFQEYLQSEMFHAPKNPRRKGVDKPWTIGEIVYGLASQFGGAHVDKYVNGAFFYLMENPTVQSCYLEIADAAVKLGLQMLDENITAIFLEGEAGAYKDDYEFWYGLGLNQDRKECHADAIIAFNKAIKLKPTYSAYFARAVAYSNSPDTDKAIEDLKRASEIKSNDPVLWNYLGISYAEKGNSTKAIESYEKAISLRPNYSEAWYGLGLVLQNNGFGNKAIKAYQKATQFDPDLLNAWNNWGNIYSQAMMPDNALSLYREVVLRNPEHKLVWYNSAKTLSYSGHDKSIVFEHLRKAIKLTPEDKKCAREDLAFQRFWEDEDFVKLTQENELKTS